MRAVLTRVNNAKVCIDNKVSGEIQKGYLVLLGIHETDTNAQADKIIDRINGLRIFEDEKGKMNLNCEAAGCKNILIVSQFTLYADCKSRRPGFTKAARPEIAVPLYEYIINKFKELDFNVQTGQFGADMQVFSQNDGPVTIILDTEEL